MDSSIYTCNLTIFKASFNSNENRERIHASKLKLHLISMKTEKGSMIHSASSINLTVMWSLYGRVPGGNPPARLGDHMTISQSCGLCIEECPGETHLPDLVTT